jgi:hypothetical protein
MINPSRITISADGELVLLFFGRTTQSGGSHPRVAFVACGEDGMYATLQNTTSLQVTSWDVGRNNIRESLDKIEAFVNDD